MKVLLLLASVVFANGVYSQNFTRKDSLHGGLRHERTSYDVKHYAIDISIDPEARTISGYNDIAFNVVDTTNKIQIDLFENIAVDSIIYNGNRLSYYREYNAVFVLFPNQLQKATQHSVKFYYSGMPITAKRAPWDGGFDWKKDSNEKHWIGVACQGTGASLWIPVKDSQTDEPDNGATIKVAVPNGLMNVSNGRFLGSSDLKNGYTRWDWEVKNPINSYDITVNIGDYVHISDKHNDIDLDYYVLRSNEAVARQQFSVVKPMLDCFNSKFGTYPFATDGYKLVETPYLGMEHQSAVAYGNEYKMGYRGMDLSGTGIGMLFDFIVIHESAHEWFGNSITSADVADMWIHESFTTYAETVFVECQYGYEKAMQYINGQSRNVQNDIPVIGTYGVQNEGSSDMYYKGSLMLNTIRHIVADDTLWWKTLLKFSQTFRHKIIDTPTVIAFFNRELARDLSPVFNQYLTTTQLPNLDLSSKNGVVRYKWSNVLPGFNMPVDIKIGDTLSRLYPTESVQQISMPSKTDSVQILKDHFFITVK